MNEKKIITLDLKILKRIPNLILVKERNGTYTAHTIKSFISRVVNNEY